jgi:hypothetical protein
VPKEPFIRCHDNLWTNLLTGRGLQAAQPAACAWVVCSFMASTDGMKGYTTRYREVLSDCNMALVWLYYTHLVKIRTIINYNNVRINNLVIIDRMYGYVVNRFNAATHTYRCMYQRRTGLQQPYSRTMKLMLLDLWKIMLILLYCCMAAAGRACQHAVRGWCIHR